MKAAVLEALEKIVVKELPNPICGDEEVIVEPQAVSVCGSDVRIFHYGNNRVKPPTVIGHEFAAKVVQVGKNVTRLKIGDRIVCGADIPSGTDPWCLRGLPNLEEENYAIGYQLEGAFQQQMKLNAMTVRYGPIVKIPDSLTYEEACLTEPLACAIHGMELAQMTLGKSVCVIGLGPIGCMVLELCKWWGASQVFGVQRSKKRLEMARQFLPEAQFISTEDEDMVQTLLRQTNGKGVDLVITTSGSVQAHEQAIEIVGKRGYVNLFGGLKNQPKAQIDSNLIHYKEAFVMGSHGSNLPDVERAVQLLAQGKIQAKKYISKTFTLDQINEALTYHESRAGLKVIVYPQK